MLFVALALALAVLESYIWLFRPGGFTSVNALTICLPILVASGAVRRPASERTAILVFVATLGVSLNRSAIAPTVLVHVAVFAGAALLAWQGYGTAAAREPALKRLAVAAGVAIVGFLIPWALSLICG